MLQKHLPYRRTSVGALTAAVFVSALWASMLAAAEPAPRRGEVRFEPVADENQIVPAPFRLPAQTFTFQQSLQPGWEGDVIVSLVTFPSPVKTPHANNNTVHCEYYRPAKPGKHPACVVLHILGGDFPLARVFAHHLAKQGVAALFLKMPYYGERRQPGVDARMISVNPEETVRGMTQAVKDIRFAAAWLAAQDEVDASQLGVFGISLGGITASLAATAEPRFAKVCPVLAGGDMGRVLRDSQEKRLATARERWLAGGHTLEELVGLMKTVDPCTYGNCINGRQVLMLNAMHDEIIPRHCTESLWIAFGRPTIHWYNANHFTAALYITDALQKVGDFFKADQAKVEGPTKAEGRAQKAE